MSKKSSKSVNFPEGLEDNERSGKDEESIDPFDPLAGHVDFKKSGNSGSKKRSGTPGKKTNKKPEYV